MLVVMSSLCRFLCVLLVGTSAEAYRLPSFATRLQRARTASSALELLEDAAAGKEVDVLQKLAMLTPRAHGEREAAQRVRSDARLSTLNLSPTSLSPLQRCQVLWSLGMIYPPDEALPPPLLEMGSRLATALEEELPGVEPHIASTALWACSTIGLPAPRALAARAAEAPFVLYPGAVTGALAEIGASAGGGGSSEGEGALSTLAAELHLRHDYIASGSTAPSRARVPEDRGTAWMSDSAKAFAYSGKVMAPEGA
jgi:hypothetical protein